MTNEPPKESVLPSLGVLVITHDEEENIERCLRSVQFAEHVLVVDSLSSDRTVEIARGCGAEVHVRPWSGYSAQKQYALEQLRTDWVLWIDADEEVPPDLQSEIRERLAAGGVEAGLLVPRMVHYLGRWIRHGGWYPDPKLRLFRRAAGRFDGRLVHEGVRVEGPIGRLRSPLHHYPYRDRRHHAAKVETYARLAARQAMQEGRSVAIWDEIFRPPLRFLRMWILKAGFLDGVPGWVAASMAARYVRLKYRYVRLGVPGGAAPPAGELPQ